MKKFLWTLALVLWLSGTATAATITDTIYFTNATNTTTATNPNNRIDGTASDPGVIQWLTGQDDWIMYSHVYTAPVGTITGAHLIITLRQNDDAPEWAYVNLPERDEPWDIPYLDPGTAQYTAHVSPAYLTANPGHYNVFLSVFYGDFAIDQSQLVIDYDPFRTLTVTSSNPNSGVSITVNPNDNSGQGIGTTPFTRTYNNNTPVTLTASATANGNSFRSWTGCTNTSGTTCNVTMDSAKTVTANFAPSLRPNSLPWLMLLLEQPATDPTVTLILNVTIPASTPLDKSVFMAGNLSQLDGGLMDWNPSGGALSRLDAAHWSITLTGKAGTQIQYKYTLGDWDHVEKDSTCSEMANRQLTLSHGSTGKQTANDLVMNWLNVSPCGS